MSYWGISREIGLSYKTIRRWLDEEFAERDRRHSRETKQRYQGVCSECGGPTRYSGHGTQTSLICRNCANRRSNRDRLGDGPRVRQIFAYLADGERRLTEISHHLDKPVKPTSSLLRRMLTQGLLERPRRGVYRIAEQLPAGVERTIRNDGHGRRQGTLS